VTDVSIYDKGLGLPEGCPGPVCTLYALASFRAPAAKVKRVLLRLISRLGVDSDLAQSYPAIVAGVGFATRTPAMLCVVDPHGQDVLAVLMAVQEVGTVAGLFAVVDRVEAPTRAAGHEVEVLASFARSLAYLVAAGAVELERP
jgi:hypothetical protein